MQNSDKLISMGQINFINCAPINCSFEKWHISSLKVSNGYPALINQLFSEELLHIAPVSSIEYIKNKDKYSLIETVCISSNGEVGSVILFSNHKLSDLKGKKIGVPYTSATSIALVKILLNENGISPEECNFIVHKYKTSLENQLNSDFDAVLYIGDPALIANTNRKDESIYRYDLGKEWKELTGLPMVFGTWVVWSDWKTSHPEEFEWLSLLLDKAVDAGLSVYLNEITESISSRLNLEKFVIVDYLTNKIVYKFTLEHARSLEIFEAKYNLIRKL